MKPNSAIRKRIYNELDQLSEEYATTNLSIINTPINNTPYKSSIDITLYDPYNKNYPKNMKFKLNTQYPFQPPSVFIYNKETNEYIEWVKTIHCCNLPNIMKHLEKYNYRSCINDKYIQEIWSPASRLINMLTEIEIIQIIKREVKYRLTLEKIEKKYPFPSEIGDYILSYIIPFMTLPKKSHYVDRI